MLDLKLKSICLAGVFLLFTACGRSHETAEHRSGDPDSAAGKSGKVAYTVSKETEKAAEVASKEAAKAAKILEHKVAAAAKDAHEGWKDASEKDKAKHDQ